MMSGCRVSSENPHIAPIKEEIIEKLATTDKIIVIHPGEPNIITRTITDEEEIEEIIAIVSRTTETVGPVTFEGHNKRLRAYNKNDELITSIYIWHSAHIGFRNAKDYTIELEDDYDTLMEIIFDSQLLLPQLLDKI